MIKIIKFIFIIIWKIICFLLGISSSKKISGIVKKVYDGDTILIVDSKNQSHYIRFSNIDAPESNQTYGKQATSALQNKIGNKQVTAKIKGKSHNRVVGTIYQNGTNINLWMVTHGFAWAIKKYSGSTPYVKAHTKAQRKKKGLWKQKNPTEPWKWRRN